MKIEELTNCPDWLKEAVTENADVEIIDGLVHWHSGTWNNGTWNDGTWNDGTWKGGIWKRGFWERGLWHNGIWLAGTWKTGVWESGYQTIRFKYSPLFVSPTQIKIGCKIKTREEWDEWFAGDEEYSTRRETSTFKLIEANYNAFIAYAETLNLIPKK